MEPLCACCWPFRQTLARPGLHDNSAKTTTAEAALWNALRTLA